MLAVVIWGGQHWVGDRRDQGEFKEGKSFSVTIGILYMCGTSFLLPTKQTEFVANSLHFWSFLVPYIQKIQYSFSDRNRFSLLLIFLWVADVWATRARRETPYNLSRHFIFTWSFSVANWEDFWWNKVDTRVQFYQRFIIISQLPLKFFLGRYL